MFQKIKHTKNQAHKKSTNLTPQPSSFAYFVRISCYQRLRCLCQVCHTYRLYVPTLCSSLSVSVTFKIERVLTPQRPSLRELPPLEDEIISFDECLEQGTFNNFAKMTLL